MVESILQKANEISCNTVLANCKPTTYVHNGKVHNAELPRTGLSKFHGNVWMRDTFYSAKTLLALGKADALKNTIKLTFDMELPTGEKPRKLDGTGDIRRNLSVKRKYLRTVSHMRPDYKTASWWPLSLFGPKQNPIDTYPLVVIAMHEYIDHTGDIDFAKQYMDHLDRNFSYMESKEHDGFMVQQPHSDWRDHWHYAGKTALQQILYAQACDAMAQIKQQCGHDGTKYAQKGAALKKKINEELWDDEKGHYITAIDPLRDQLSVPDNAFAIIHGIASDEQSRRIVKNFKDLHDAHGFMPIHYPEYPKQDVAFFRKPDFAAGWWRKGTKSIGWIPALAAEASAGYDPEFSEKLLAQLGTSIIEHGNAEVLHHDGEKLVPFTGPRLLKFFSGFDHGFHWGAKAYVQAYDALQKKIAPVNYVA